MAAVPSEAADLLCMDRAPGEAPLCNIPHNFLEHYELQTLIGAGGKAPGWVRGFVVAVHTFCY